MNISQATEPKTITEALEASIITTSDPISEVITDALELEMAIANATMDGKEYLILSDELMTRRCKSKTCNSMTVGQPGVRLYRDGKKDACDDVDNMSATDYHNRFLHEQLRAKR